MRRLSRRGVLQRVVVGLAVSALTGCRPNASPTLDAGREATPTQGRAQLESKEPTELPQQGPITLAWLMRSNPRENAWEEERAKTWQSQHPDVSINLIIVPYAEMDPKLNAMVAAGTPPDVFSQWGEAGFGDYFARELPLEITPYIETDGFDMGQFLPGSVDPYVRDEKYYSMPQVNNFGILLFYNKKLFDEAGLDYPPTSWEDESWNWDKMLICAQALTKNWGQGMDAQYGARMTSDVHHLAFQFGTDAFLPEHYETGFARSSRLDAPDVIESVQMRADLIHEKKVSPTPAEEKTFAQLGDIFMTGKVGMVMSGSWGMRTFQDAEFSFGVAPVPGRKGRRVYAFTGCWMIARASQHPREAWEFVKFLVSEESLRGLAKVGFGVPLEKVVRDTWLPLYQEKTGMSIEQLAEVVFGSLKHSQEHPNHLFVGWPQIIQTINQDVDQVWLGNRRAEEVLPETKQKLDVVLNNIWGEFH